MTTFDLSQIKPIPGFDSLKWKQEVQEKIYEATKHMTPEQRREHTRQASERFQADMKRRRIELAALAETADSQSEPAA
jgi:hypothetical protein